MGWSCRGATIALVLALAGCGVQQQHHGVLGSDVSGADVAQRIDAWYGLSLRARFPDLTVGKASCPGSIDVAYGQTGECTLPIAGATIPVVVTGSTQQQDAFGLRIDDSIVAASDANRDLEAQLFRRYGRWFTVNCGPQSVIVLPRDTHFSCSATLPGTRITAIDAVAGGFGFGVDASRVSALQPREDTTFGRYLSHPGTPVVPGPVLARYVHDSAFTELHGELIGSRLVGAATCPPRVALADSSPHVFCTVRIDGAPVRYEIWHDFHGVNVENARAGVDTGRVRQYAQRYVDLQMAANGRTEHVAVSCGRDRIVFVDPGTTLPCTLTLSGYTMPLNALVADADGHVQLMVPGPQRQIVNTSDLTRAVVEAIRDLVP